MQPGAAQARGEFLLFLIPMRKTRAAGSPRFSARRSRIRRAILTAAPDRCERARQKVFDVFPFFWTLFGAARSTASARGSRPISDPRSDRADVLEVDWVSGSAFSSAEACSGPSADSGNGFWMYSEDVDLCRRARDAGHQVAVAGAATLVHAHGGASRKDSETAALTRSEVVVSRHFYASRHLGPWRADVPIRLGADAFRSGCAAVFAAALGFGSLRAIRVRAGVAGLALLRQVPSGDGSSRPANRGYRGQVLPRAEMPAGVEVPGDDDLAPGQRSVGIFPAGAPCA